MATATQRKGRIARFGAAAILSIGLVGAIAPTAFAQETNTDTTPAEAPHRPKLTDDQKACLKAQGVEKPAPGANGERVRPTDAQRAAFKKAAEACNIDLPLHRGGPGHRHPKLTDAQKTCLEQQGVQKPAPGANGERVRPTDAQRTAFRAAAKACGISVPDKPPADGNADNSNTST